ncbi:UNVERIFIED_CONTAM: hypothetical protein Sradi_0769500 [Sesamum radiatum]|uniref:Uncharacterized protein n=1 Tax=Sesamum radiatum TaxID=300843 RepID=A0AAW2VRL3_SESRA
MSTWSPPEKPSGVIVTEKVLESFNCPRVPQPLTVPNYKIHSPWWGCDAASTTMLEISIRISSLRLDLFVHGRGSDWFSSSTSLRFNKRLGIEVGVGSVVARVFLVYLRFGGAAGGGC